MSDKASPEELLEFPCQYEFKAVGVASPKFRFDVVAAINKHIDLSEDAVRTKPSGKGNYQSVSSLVTLQSYQQLTAIYAELRTVEGLKLLL